MPSSLMDETEKLVQSMVSEARRGRWADVKGEDGIVVRKRVPVDPLEKVRAVTAALNLLNATNKLPEEAPMSEYERGLKELHGDEPDDSGEGSTSGT